MNTTFYTNAYSEQSIDVEINQILSAIKKGKYKDTIEHIRTIQDPEKRRKEKAKLPAFTVSGIFHGKKADTIKQHSGYIAIDIDSLGDQVDHARSVLYADPHTYAGFLSVSGNGLCLIVPIDPERHIDSFDGLEKYYFSRYGYQIDIATRNVNRLRFVSHDPDLYLNPKAVRFSDYPKKPSGRTKNEKTIITTDDDFGHVLGQIMALRIDLTKEYYDWLKIGMAIKSKYGDSGLEYFQQISQFHPDYDPSKTERKYRSLDPKSVTISSFFHIAKHCGLEIATQKTAHLRQVATFAKKGKRTIEEAIQQIERLDGISPEQAKPIVKAVFETPESDLDPTNEGEDTIYAIETFIKRNHPVTYNEITFRYESEGKPMTDRDFNTVYLNTKTVIPKANRELVQAIIESDRTQKHNPIRDWFSKNSHRKTCGAISELSDSISSPTQSPEYINNFIRYWLVGAVAMWYKYHSPLMLVLAGAKQNTGKSHFFRYLLPNDLQPYYAESYLTGDKDENILMCSKIIIMNDEMSNKSKRDIAMIKDLCSKQWFNVRKPYGRTSEDMRRIAALAGTSNDLALLSDPSGNRRIIPIHVDAIDHAKYNAIDKADLWIEAYHAFKSGERYHLDQNDINYLENNTEEFIEPSSEYEALLAFFRIPQQGEMPQYFTNTDLLGYLNTTSLRLSSKKLGMVLRKLGVHPVKIRRNGQPVQAYPLMQTGRSS